MKTYVGVTVEHDKDGNLTPLIIHWPDGRKFNIDRVIDVRMAPALIAGGHGTRYTCRIRNKEVYLFNDPLDGKWFIEH
jgi:hypothetical protein